ncbi:MAG: hypothetical protein WC025_02710 [Candidatus Magasanikbacteria bacterium]
MEKEFFRKLILEAINAPSGENSQPWRFVCSDNKIDLYNLPNRDNPIYNYKQHGSLFAHGALLENLSIVADFYGYDTTIDFLPDFVNNFVASINLIKKIDETKKTSLFDSIKKRTTNRKIYQDKELSFDMIEKIKEIANSSSDVNVVFVNDTGSRKKMASIFSKNDAITLEDKELHDVFFENIRWNKEEESVKKNGLFLDTMELAPPQEKIFKLLRNSKIASFFRKIKLTRFIANENAKIYASSPLFISFVIDNKDENYLKAGMIAEKIWLTAIDMGLYCQPLAALPYLYDRIENSEIKKFSEEHTSIIKESYSEMCDILKISKEKMVCMTLRVGYSQPPRALSSKMEPEIIFV